MGKPFPFVTLPARRRRDPANCSPGALFKNLSASHIHTWIIYWQFVLLSDDSLRYVPSGCPTRVFALFKGYRCDFNETLEFRRYKRAKLLCIFVWDEGKAKISDKVFSRISSLDNSGSHPDTRSPNSPWSLNFPQWIFPLEATSWKDDSNARRSFRARRPPFHSGVIKQRSEDRSESLRPWEVVELDVAPDVRRMTRLAVYWRARRQASRRVGRNANRRRVSSRVLTAATAVRGNAKTFCANRDEFADGFIAGRTLSEPCLRVPSSSDKWLSSTLGGHAGMIAFARWARRGRWLIVYCFSLICISRISRDFVEFSSFRYSDIYQKKILLRHFK